MDEGKELGGNGGVIKRMMDGGEEKVYISRRG